MTSRSQARGFALDLGGAVELADWWPIAAAVGEGIVQANLAWMRAASGRVRRLHELGVVYEPSTLRGREWPVRLAPAVVEARRGNCLDLCCYHAAYLRLHGTPTARVRIIVPHDADTGHAVVVGPFPTVDPLELCV